MTICLADVYQPALQETRRVIRDLARRGVTLAIGCVITSAADMGEPPAGHDRVLVSMKPGSTPLDDAEHVHVQSVMTAEMAAIAQAVMAAEGDAARVTYCNYVLLPMAGTASLKVTMHGLVDHEVRVVLS